MGPVGVGVADPIDNCNLALVVQVFNGGRRWNEAKMVVQGQHLVLGYAHVAPVIVVQRVAVGNQGVQVVIPAGKLDNDQNWVFLGCRHDRSSFLVG